MSNDVKVLFAGEKAVRNINQGINDIFIDQLIREDLTLEEKRELAEKAKKVSADNAKLEEKNSEFWYKYGKNDGEIRGMLKAVGVLGVGLVVGRLLRKR